MKNRELRIRFIELLLKMIFSLSGLIILFVLILYERDLTNFIYFYVTVGIVSIALMFVAMLVLIVKNGVKLIALYNDYKIDKKGGDSNE